ncbi:hypothetical protein CBER1_04723 [Cercospora berteroae]|uniref:J domain-containing protein n=1 Tax=Cercospora berteroae TaxID=357750 RepID=A0A2S6BR49_9PEZI|nr:hypothetical protein CBER1_04723 [Cercospora berteroae]
MAFSQATSYGGITVARFLPLATRLVFWWAARYIIPNIIAKYVQIALYAIFSRKTVQRSGPESIRICEDRERIYKVVVIAMFAFTVHQVDRRIQSEENYYRMLGIPFDADTRVAKRAFRTLAKKYHPDKIAPEEPQNDFFLRLRAALSVISDAELRHAYHRYGNSALDCTSDCRINDDYMFRAFLQQQVFYIAWAVKSVVFAFRGNWQWILWLALPTAALATVEVHAVLRSPVLGLCPYAFNAFMELARLRQPYLPFEMVALLRSAINAGFFALSQLRLMKTARYYIES